MMLLWKMGKIFRRALFCYCCLHGTPLGVLTSNEQSFRHPALPAALVLKRQKAAYIVLTLILSCRPVPGDKVRWKVVENFWKVQKSRQQRRHNGPKISVVVTNFLRLHQHVERRLNDVIHSFIMPFLHTRWQMSFTTMLLLQYLVVDHATLGANKRNATTSNFLISRDSQLTDLVFEEK